MIVPGARNSEGADLGVGQPGSDEPQDLALAGDEAHLARRRRVRLAGAAGRQLAHRRQQRARRAVLGDHALRARGPGRAHRHEIPARGEQRGAQARDGGAQALAGRQAALRAEVDVDERDVERDRGGQQQRLLGVARAVQRSTHGTRVSSQRRPLRSTSWSSTTRIRNGRGGAAARITDRASAPSATST